MVDSAAWRRQDHGRYFQKGLMAMSAQKNSKTVRTVQDSKGSVYELRSELSRGGQGVVYHTQYPQVLVKGFTSKDEQLRQRWRQRLAWLIRQDLADLKIARPLVLLAEPRCGYVMELMDGLVPLQSLLESYVAAEHEGIADYLRQGGLRRRIRILCQLARTLNQLHARACCMATCRRATSLSPMTPLTRKPG